MKKISILLFAGLISLASCTNTLDKKVNVATFKEDLAEIKKSANYDSTDYETLAFAVGMTTLLGKNEKIDQTYRQALDELKAERVKKEQEALRVKMEYEKALAAWQKNFDVVNNAVSVKVLKKGFEQDRYGFEKKLWFAYSITNNSGKDIDGIKGGVLFYDKFGDRLAANGLTYEKPLKNGQTINYTLYYDYNQFIDRDVKLKNSDLDKLKIEWEPGVILFNDGTSLQVEDKPEEPTAI
jgi:hypothetical protein